MYCTSYSAGPQTTRSVVKAARHKGIMVYLFIPVAVILIVIGLGHMALAVAGRPVTARVTGSERVLILNNDASTRNPGRYKQEYQFSVDGKRYTGSVTRVFEGESHMRQTLPARYLFFWPYVNAEDRAQIAFTGPVITGLGVLMLVLAVRRKRPQKAGPPA